MSFSKFKLDNVPPRVAPLPIASRAASAAPPDTQSRPLSPVPDDSREVLPASDDNKVPWSKRPATPAKAGELSFSLRSWKRIKTRQTTACAECKASKVRCERAPTESGDACRRCLRLDKQCFFDSKPRVRSATGKPPGHKEPVERKKILPRQAPPDSLVRRRESEPSLSFLHRPNTLSWGSAMRPFPSIENKQLDIKIDSLLSRDVAQQVFLHFVTNVAPKCPLIVFADGTSAEFVRETRPLLFLTILSVAAYEHCTVEKQVELALESKRALANRAMVQREKSLEIVQSLQVVCLWYRAVDGHQQMKLTQLVQNMVTMALDLGLNRRPQPVGGFQTSWDRAEGQRTWLGCFLISASVSLILRCPRWMNWTPDMDTHINELLSSRASHSDGFLCELIRTEQACHTAHQILTSNSSLETARINNPGTLGLVQARIDSWASRSVNAIQKCLVAFGKAAGSLYVHELVMHVDSNMDEFRAPFSANSLQSCSFLTGQMDDVKISMVRRIISASHGLLNAFLGLAPADILTLTPHIYGGRVIYSLVLLCKLFIAIRRADGKVRDLIRVGDLRLDEYLNHFAILANELAIRDNRNALSRSFLIMEQLRNWYRLERERTPSSSDTCPALIARNSHVLYQEPSRAVGQSTQRLEPVTAPSSHSDCDLFLTDGDGDGADAWFCEDFFHLNLYN